MDNFKNEGSSSSCCSLKQSACVVDEDNDNENVEYDNENVEYPINTKPLENQVAGHAFKDGKCTFGKKKVVKFSLSMFIISFLQFYFLFCILLVLNCIFILM